MDGKYFCIGLALGMVGGAIIVANSTKARQMVKDGQSEIRRKAEELTKKCNCDCDCEESEVKEKKS